jgi:predicted membrane protein
MKTKLKNFLWYFAALLLVPFIITTISLGIVGGFIAYPFLMKSEEEEKHTWSVIKNRLYN